MSNFSSRWLVLPFAFSLSTLLIMSFAPILGVSSLLHRWEFLALWGVALCLLSLPMIYLEIGLAQRGKISVLQGLMSLTREADAQPIWRWMGWLGVFFISFLAGSLLKVAVLLSPAYLTWTGAMMGIAVVIAVALSFLQRWILIALLLLSVIVAPFFSSQAVLPFALQWGMDMGQMWAVAVILALVSTGFGMSLYWQQLVGELTHSQSANSTAWAIWGALFVAGVLYIILPIHFVLGNLILAALLLNYIRQQVMDRQLGSVVAWIIMLSGSMIWLIPSIEQGLFVLLVILGLVLSLLYSIFAGWVMKASHLRKALNFGSEMSYNIWRVAVRIVIPVSIVSALILSMIGLVS